jgi:hypothetical protein
MTIPDIDATVARIANKYSEIVECVSDDESRSSSSRCGKELARKVGDIVNV